MRVLCVGVCVYVCICLTWRLRISIAHVSIHDRCQGRVFFLSWPHPLCCLKSPAFKCWPLSCPVSKPSLPSWGCVYLWLMSERSTEEEPSPDDGPKHQLTSAWWISEECGTGMTFHVSALSLQRWRPCRWAKSSLFSSVHDSKCFKRGRNRKFFSLSRVVKFTQRILAHDPPWSSWQLPAVQGIPHAPVS